MHEIIENILADLIIGAEAIPAAPLRFRGKAPRFVTWTITSEDPEVSADDDCVMSVVEVDVDIYSVAEYVDIMEAVKSRFIAAGWVWTGSSPEMFEESTGLYHRTVSFSKERMIYQ